IEAAPTHSGEEDEPIDVESNSKEESRDETGEDLGNEETDDGLENEDLGGETNEEFH
ncbi:hypothetical protein KI387_044523, partial [Taxus chinensis]